jgi:hypothetical protein
MPRYGQADLIWGSRELPHGAVLRKDPRGGGRDAGSGYAASARDLGTGGMPDPAPSFRLTSTNLKRLASCLRAGVTPLKRKGPPKPYGRGGYLQFSQGPSPRLYI